jgi:tetratricopeptide (TPR) repeat protein
MIKNDCVKWYKTFVFLGILFSLAFLSFSCKEKAKDLPLESDDVAGYIKRAEAYLELATDNREFQSEYYNKAEFDFSKAIEIEPQNRDLYYKRGDYYCQYNLTTDSFASGAAEKASFADGIADYSMVISLSPDVPEAYIMRGRSYFEAKEDDKAIADYDMAISLYSKAISLKPNDPDTYRMRGELYFKVKEYNKAIADYSKVISLEPEDPRAYRMRGRSYFEAEEYNKAITNFEKSQSLDPDNGIGYFYIGNVYNVGLKDYSKAIDFYELALEVDPDNWRYKTELAAVKAWQKKLVEEQQKIAMEKQRIAEEKKAKEREEFLKQFPAYTAQQLNNELTKDIETTRDQQRKVGEFIGKRFSITGVVDDISVDLFGDITVYFAKSSNYNMVYGTGDYPAINCHFSSRHAAALNDLKKGQKITVLGELDVASLGMTIAIIGNLKSFADGINIKNCTLP